MILQSLNLSSSFAKESLGEEMGGNGGAARKEKLDLENEMHETNIMIL